MRQLTLIAITLSLLVAIGCTHRSDEKLTALAEASINNLRGGQLSEALTSAERGLALTQDGPPSGFAIRFRLLKAEILIVQGQVAAARLILEVPIPDTMPYRALAAKRRYLTGKALQVLKNSAEAVTILEDARRLAEAASAVDVLMDSEDLLGQIHLLSDRYDAARTVLSRALVRAETSHDRYRVAKILTDLGMVELRRGSYEEALSYFERAILYSDLRSTAVYAVALHNAGICYSRLGEFKRALQVQQDSISVFENGGLKGYLERTLGDMGNTYVLMGDSTRGAEYLARAASVAREAHLTSDAALWTGNLAAAYIDTAAWDKAERANQEAHLFLETADPSSLPRGALKINNLLNTARIAEGKGGYQNAAAIYDAVLAEAKGDPVFSWEAHQGLATVALAVGQPAQAARHFEAALALIEETQAGLLKTDYQLSFLARLVRFYQEYVDALVSRGSIERALEVADSSRARVLAEREGNGAPVARRARAAK
jgi:tetratricopeptide (TPR) repeat protein